MSHTHVVIDAFAVRKCLHANPANVCLATCASHVVASLSPLDERLATRATFDVVRFCPLFEQLLAINITIRTCYAIMGFDVTARTDASQA